MGYNARMENWNIRQIRPDTFGSLPPLAPPAGYVCFLRDVSYGNRYQIRQVGAPADLSRHLAQAFEVEVALVFQADNAKQIERELLKFVGEASAGEWFDLDDERLQFLRQLRLARQGRQQARRRSETLSSLLEKSEPDASRPRSTSHRHVNRAAAVPSSSQARPARQRSTAHRTTSRAAAPPTLERSDRAAQPRRRNRSAKLLFIVFLLLIIGGLYGAITERDPVTDVRHLVETARAAIVIAEPTATEPPPSATEVPRLAVRVAQSSHNSVRFEWSSAAGATNYQYRYSVNDGAFTRWTRIFTDVKTVADLSPGDRVIFQFRARFGDSYTPIAQASARTLSRPTATSTPTNPPPNATVTATNPPPSATATIEVRNEVFYVKSSAVARRCAKHSCDLVQTLDVGTKITARRYVTGSQLNGSNRWIQLNHQGELSYIHESFLSRTRPRIQPTPTPSPTKSPPTATYTPTEPPPTATYTATEPPPTATFTSTATSSPEPSATSTWTPVPSATSLRMVVETRNNLGANARACPRTSCEILTTLRPGDEILGLGRVEGDEVYGSTDWVQFEIDGVAAYIHSELIEAKR